LILDNWACYLSTVIFQGISYMYMDLFFC
jgi:hypothetical protein